MGATAFVTGASSVIMGTLPLLVGLFSRTLHLNWQQIGWLGTVGQAGTLSGTLIAYWLIERGIIRRGVQVGALCALIFWTLAAFADSFVLLLSWRAITAAGVGCFFAIGTYLLGGASSPARAFSLMSGVQVVCGALHSAAMPWLEQHFGPVVAILSIDIWFAAILLMVVWTWSRASAPLRVSRAPSDRDEGGADGGGAARLVVSIVAFQTAVVVMWMYCERIADAAGLPAAGVGFAIALGNLGGIPASIFGMLASGRIGFMPVLALATLAVVCGELFLFLADSVAVFAAGQLMFNFGWMLGLSYYLGLLAHEDAGGRLIRLAPPALVIAGGIGPTAIALFTKGSDPTPVLGVSLACCLGAFAIAMYRRRA